MRKLSDSEMLSLRELLQMETNAITKAKAMEVVATDKDLKQQISTGILAGESRVRGIQQFISENEVLTPGEVH
jgi:hypothetical protein